MIDELTGEEAADLCRRLARLGADRRINLMLAVRGQSSERPGDHAAMLRYEAALRAGRRIKFSVFHIDNFTTTRVPEDLERAVEDALQGDRHDQNNIWRQSSAG